MCTLLWLVAQECVVTVCKFVIWEEGSEGKIPLYLDEGDEKPRWRLMQGTALPAEPYAHAHMHIAIALMFMLPQEYY